MKNFLLIIFLILLVGLGIFIYSISQSDIDTPETPSTSDVSLSLPTPIPTKQPLPQETTIPEDWELLQAASYQLYYPAQATTTLEGSDATIVFIGPTQVASGRTQTELFDGYSFRVSKILDVGNYDLQDYAQFAQQQAVDNCIRDEGIVNDLIKVESDFVDGYQYSSTNCYIDYTETIAQFESDLYRITSSYVGEPADYQNYKDITEQIFETLRFE